MVEKYLDKQGAQALANAINSKQSELTFDSTPTADSTNPVTSGGIKTYVDAAINNLPEPMVFKGTLGTGGTITSLPAAAASNEGHTYKVITEITSPSIAGETITLAQAHAVENFDFNKVTTLNFTNDYNPATAIFVNYDPSSTERMLEMEISGNASQIKFKKVDDLYVAYPGTGMNRMFEDTGAPSYNLNKSRLKTMLLDIAKQTGELEIGLKPTTITAGTPLESIYEDVVLLTLEGTLAKVGDTVISNGSSWVVIPSGDEPSGTVTSVGMTVPTGLSVSGSPVTTSGTLAVSYANGYSIPTTAKQAEWDEKVDYITAEDELPDASEYDEGTVCKLISTEWKNVGSANNGSAVNWPLKVQSNGNTLNYAEVLADGYHGGYDAISWHNGVLALQNTQYSVYEELNKTVQTDGTNTIHIYSGITSHDENITGDYNWYYSDDANVLSNLYQFLSAGFTIQEGIQTETFYISNGSAWVEISDDIVAIDPDGDVDPVGDISTGGGGVPQIYIEMDNYGDGNSSNRMMVKGADDFLNENYVPVLMRKSNRRISGVVHKGWHRYGNYDGNHSPMGANFVTVDPITKVISVNGEEDLTYFPQPKGQSSKHVSHGKVQYELYDGDDTYHNAKCPWGFSFVKVEDFDTNSPFDVTKLVTNIAPFYVYYHWNHQQNNHIIIMTRIL